MTAYNGGAEGGPVLSKLQRRHRAFEQNLVRYCGEQSTDVTIGLRDILDVMWRDIYWLYAAGRDF